MAVRCAILMLLFLKRAVEMGLISPVYENTTAQEKLQSASSDVFYTVFLMLQYLEACDFISNHCRNSPLRLIFFVILFTLRLFIGWQWSCFVVGFGCYYYFSLNYLFFSDFIWLFKNQFFKGTN